jgi:hypothetical protein
VQQSKVVRPRSISRRCAAVVFAAALLVIAVGVVLFPWRRAFEKKHPQDYALLIKPVVQTPETRRANEVDIPDDAVVIGVDAGGCRRAYLLEALVRPQFHVINDLLCGIPVTVSYCDMTGCIVVHTDPNGDRPLEIAVGGWQGHYVAGKPQGGMLLRLGSSWYRQDTGLQPLHPDAPPFPYPKTDYTRTTWKEWSSEHKDTDVFVGDYYTERTGPVIEGVTMP